MTDTRCANPEYQLEVDEMVVEYLLYKTIESHLGLVALQIRHLSDGDGFQPPSPTTASKRQEAVKLQRDLDNHLKLFHLHHPGAQFSGNIAFNIKLVRFVVYLSIYIPRGTRTHLHERNDWRHPSIVGGLRQAYQVTDTLSPNIIQNSRSQRVVFTILRRNWLNIRHASQPPSEDTDMDGSDELGARKRQKRDGQYIKDEPNLDKSTESSERTSKLALQSTGSISPKLGDINRSHPPAPSNLVAQQSSDLYALTLFELTGHFMEMFLHISRVMSDLNGGWIELASEIMLQSGIERLQEISGALASAEREHDKTKTFTKDLKDLKLGLDSWINECFAWGSITRPSSTSVAQLSHECLVQQSTVSDEQLRSQLLLEDHICAMFNSSIDISLDDDEIFDMLDNTSSKDATKHEIKQLTKLRDQYLQELLEISINCEADGNQHYVPAVKELCRKHPVEPCLKGLHNFIEEIWRYNMRTDISGKPILVQIEEGGLDGLDGTEFNEFLERCGLKMSRAGGAEGTLRIRWA